MNMKWLTMAIVGAGVFAGFCEASAADESVFAWRGEKVVVWYDATNTATTAALAKPSCVQSFVRTGLAMPVKGNGDALFADRVVWNGSTLVQPGEAVRVVAEVDVPRTGDVPADFTVSSGLDARRYGLSVSDRAFPAGRDRRMFLDLWQHPWAVARYYQTPPFSKQHYAKMRPLWEQLADAGQKTITATIMNRPWAHQCFDAYGTMVRHIRTADGGWRFDYTIFDEYVAFAQSCGLGPQIHCYTLCPFRLKRYDWEDEKGVQHTGNFDVGSPEFVDYWRTFLGDFAAHLKAKGWFENTYIALDERSPAELKAACDLVRKYGGMKIAMAGDRPPSQFDGIEIDTFSIALQCVTPKYIAETQTRRRQGRTTTFYVAGGNPSTGLAQPPIDCTWLGAYAGAVDLDGFLRWAYCSWPANPNSDGNYLPWFEAGNGYWPAGATYLVYPHAPSLRFLALRNGLNLSEKICRLRAEGKIDAELAATLRAYEYKGRKAYPSPSVTADLIARTAAQIHRASRTAVSDVASSGDLFDRFANPPRDTRPWTYYFWTNSQTDRETISAEMADIARLGFGGTLITDSRGYWDDEDHVVNPPATIRWGSDAWFDLIAHVIREGARHDVKVSLNVAASGGHLRGDMDVGADSPKFLKCRRYLPGDAFEKPNLPHYRDVAVFAVRTKEPAVRTGWANAGDGFLSMEGNVGKVEDTTRFIVSDALDVRELASAADGATLGADWTILRFGWATQKGREQDIDVLDRQAVRRHLDRAVAPILARVPGLVGKDKTFAGLYNVSWEGTMPTWSATFEQDFAADAGYAFRPNMPILAGFRLKGVSSETFMRDMRRARGRMMVNHLYVAVRTWAHEHGMIAFSESGGPWGQKRDPRTFGECDQFEFLNGNDFPQGEFWPIRENGTHPSTGHANANMRPFYRGIVEAAHRAGKRINSVEAFTHMHRHWTVDPAFLKPLGDIVFADGVNLIVWHTYTTSPKKFGVPGLEYFAGSHINRNVTWNRDLPAFIHYLWRCQALLQAGDWVDDGEFVPPTENYRGWGRYRKDEKARFTTTHRRIGAADVFFVAGEGTGEHVFNARVDGRAVEVWDAVRVTRQPARVVGTTADGRTRLALDLPVGGSCFVVFTPNGKATPAFTPGEEIAVAGPWQVSFAYHDGISAPPPKAVKLDALVEWTTRDDLRHFAGTATYKTTFTAPASALGRRLRLALGQVPTGLARVFVNGVDCGVAWCAPWDVDVSKAVRAGTNELEIRYTNNWHNRLVGDCFLPEAERVTRSVVRYWEKPRVVPNPKNPWSIRPTVYSGPSVSDPLQKSGVLGPVKLAVEKP